MSSSSRRKDFKGVVRIDVKIPGAAPVRCEKAAVFLLDNQGEYMADDEAIVAIYDLVMPAISKSLTSISHPQTEDILQLLNEKKSAQRHTRGLVYYIQSLGSKPSMIHIHRNHANRMFNKTVSDDFVFEFDLAIACSCNTTISFQGVSSLVDGKVNTFGGDLTATPEDDVHSVSIGVFSQNVLRRITSAEKILPPVIPNEINFDKNVSGNDSNDSSQNFSSNRVNYSTPSTTNHHRGNHNGCRNLSQLPQNNFHGNYDSSHSKSAAPNRRYSLINGNIPASKLGLLASHYAGTLCCKKDESVQDRENALQQIGTMSIPQTRHRNSGKLKDSNAITKKHFLNFYEEFVGRESDHGVYVPPLDAFLPNSDMGREWEESLLPDELYTKHPAMNQAIKEDLLYLCAENKEVLSIVRTCSGGYNALHCLLTIYVPMLLDKIADNKLLEYVPDSSIAFHVRSVKEFILQSSLAGASFSRFQVWKMIIKFLPNEIKLFLTNAGTNLIYRTPGANEVDNVPYALRIENCTAFIMRELANAGINFPKRRAAVRIDPLDSAQIMAFQRTERKCYICHQPGHIASSCPLRKHDDKKSPRPARPRPAESRPKTSFRSHKSPPAVNAMEQADENETGEDAVAVEEQEEVHKDTELFEEIRLDESTEKEENGVVDHPLMVGAIGVDYDDDTVYDAHLSDGSVSADGYQWGDEFHGVYALQAGEEDIILPWETSSNVVSPSSGGDEEGGLPLENDVSSFFDFCGTCHEIGHAKALCATMQSKPKCKFCLDCHSEEDCMFLARAYKIKKKYSKRVKHAKNIEEEMSVDKKLSAIVPCPVECLSEFGVSVKRNAPLAISKLRRDVRAMRLPQKLAMGIIEEVIAAYLSSGMIDGVFYSAAAEERAVSKLEVSMKDFCDLMSNMRVNIDDL